MRDENRLKGKHDLSLDNRQIVSLFIGGIVVLGSVFVLGVVVGKKLASDEQAHKAPDLLSALDQKADAMKPVEPPLTFQDELTRREPDPKPPAAPKPVEPPNPAEPQKTEVAAAPAPHAEKVEPEPAPADRPAVEVPTRSVAPNGGLEEAFVRAAKPSEAAPNGAWTLQLLASQDRAEADRFASKLKEKGYAPFVVEAQVPGRGTWYRVRMGSFASKEAANRYLQDFRRETQIEAFVTTNR